MKALNNAMMQFMAKMMISCQKAAFLLSKKLEAKLSLREEINLKVHTMTCKSCQWYGQEIAEINVALKKMATQIETNNTKITLSNKEKQTIQTLINKELSK